MKVFDFTNNTKKKQFLQYTILKKLTLYKNKVIFIYNIKLSIYLQKEI